jgi:hypothetical protein
MLLPFPQTQSLIFSFHASAAIQISKSTFSIEQLFIHCLFTVLPEVTQRDFRHPSREITTAARNIKYEL